MSLNFYQDRIHPCSYLADQQARNIYPDPQRPINNTLYAQLIQYGFRRSGEHVYRPFCPNCNACIPVRIKVQKFAPNRSQRRCLKNNSELSIQLKPAGFNEEHYDLYQRYLADRHLGGGMDNPTPQSYQHFLTSHWSDTSFVEVRNSQQTLVAVAVTDFVHNAASAFYTFFEPTLKKQSLGTFAILKQIELAKEYHLEYLYLGYWIESSQKMNYKTRFSALQYFERQWHDFDKKTLNNQ